ncbi:hypothetical protein [Roseovarius sp. 2305UL8-3]|uniref:hypothetical protein n=1 Tax=Roseovarius conchicola TaxID=3121636 RepID=UPI003526F1A4
MTSHTPQSHTIETACTMLAVVQGAMLASLYFGVEPHPPRTIPLFAMPPFLAVSIGLALCAIRLSTLRAGRVFAGLSAVCALLSFGPQKYFDAAFPDIWIAVIASQLAVLAIVYALTTRTEAQV